MAEAVSTESDIGVKRREGKGSPSRIVAGPLLWLLPSIVVLLLITLYPSIYSLINSFRFYNLSVSDAPGPFVGLRNYVSALSDPQFVHSLLLSLVFGVLATGIEIVLGLGIALLLNLNLHGARMVRALLILPVAIAPAVVGLAFRSLYDPSAGAIPYLLGKAGISTPAAGILGDRSTALAGLVVTDAWQWTPFAALVFLAAMQGISRDLTEAARVDGAREARIMRSIMIPLIAPVVVIVVLLRFIATFNIFDIVYVQTRGGPGFSTTVTGINIYRNALESYNIGYASALTWIITVIVAILINLYLVASQRAGR